MRHHEITDVFNTAYCDLGYTVTIPLTASTTGLITGTINGRALRFSVHSIPAGTFNNAGRFIAYAKGLVK